MIGGDWMVDGYLDTDEVAKMLKFSPKTIRKMLRSKELKGSKVRGQWRVRLEDIEAYMKQNQ